jgi:hypothetical protein
MVVRRVVALGALVAAGASGSVIACTTFDTEDPPSAEPDAAPDVVVADGPTQRPPLPCDPSKLATDRQHCGACGHSCLGGDCVASTCQPVLLGTTKGEYLVDVAVDDQRVLWTSSNVPLTGPGHVYSCPKAGCAGAAPSSIAPSTLLIGSLAGDGTKAFVSFVYGGSRMSQVAPNGALTTIPPQHFTALRLGAPLYFTSLYETSTMPGTNAGQLIAWDGAKEKVVGRYDALADNVRDGIVVGGRAYFFSPYGIRTCDADAVCKDLSSSAGNTRSITTDGASLFWTNADYGDVRTCASLTDCQVPRPVLAQPQLGGAAHEVSFALGKLYVTTSAGEIWQCDPTRCAESALRIVKEPQIDTGSEHNFGHRVTADDLAIYWAASDGTPAVPSSEGGVQPSDGLTHRLMKLAR